MKEIAYENQVFGLASSFLTSGAYYIGSLWPLHGEAAMRISREFYLNIFNGAPIGDALRLSRNKIYEEHQGREIAWASYFLYGNPALKILKRP